MYEYENKSSESGRQQPVNGEYRYTGPFYQDSYSSQRTGGRTSNGTYAASSTGEVKKQKKKGGWGSLIAKTVCVALIFGVVSSAAFQATDYIGKKALDKEVEVDGAADRKSVV